MPAPTPKPGPKAPPLDKLALMILIKESAKFSKLKGLSMEQAVEEAVQSISNRYGVEVDRNLARMLVAEVYNEQ
ncbi:MAG: hypothetical protein IJG94_00430 [Clostridia bacterium]|jgi:hypothetical protein|nr:hypothetical protein [Clostridia bacterium]